MNIQKIASDLNKIQEDIALYAVGSKSTHRSQIQKEVQNIFKQWKFLSEKDQKNLALDLKSVMDLADEAKKSKNFNSWSLIKIGNAIRRRFSASEAEWKKEKNEINSFLKNSKNFVRDNRFQEIVIKLNKIKQDLERKSFSKELMLFLDQSKKDLEEMALIESQILDDSKESITAYIDNSIEYLSKLTQGASYEQIKKPLQEMQEEIQKTLNILPLKQKKNLFSKALELETLATRYLKIKQKSLILIKNQENYNSTDSNLLRELEIIKNARKIRLELLGEANLTKENINEIHQILNSMEENLRSIIQDIQKMHNTNKVEEIHSILTTDEEDSEDISSEKEVESIQPVNLLNRLFMIEMLKDVADQKWSEIQSIKDKLPKNLLMNQIFTSALEANKEIDEIEKEIVREINKNDLKKLQNLQSKLNKKSYSIAIRFRIFKINKWLAK